jgi:hypothetical protein
MRQARRRSPLWVGLGGYAPGGAGRHRDGFRQRHQHKRRPRPRLRVALSSTVLRAFSLPFSSWLSWLASPSCSSDRAVLWPQPAGGSAAVTCAAQEASCRQSTIRARRAGVFRCRLDGSRRSREFKRGGGGTLLDTACDIRGNRAHVGVVLIHPTKLDASNCPYSVGAW